MAVFILAKKDQIASSKYVTLTSKDKDWLEIINNLICPNKPILLHGKNCYRLMYLSSKMANWFESKGCGSRKSLTLKFPQIPKQYLADFIRGCWDGDGSLSFTKSANKGKNYQCQANLTSGSLSFCKTLVKKLKYLDVKGSLYEHGRTERKIEGRTLAPSNTWRVVLSGGGSVYNLVKNIYLNDKLAMPRKLALAQSIIKHREEFFLHKI